MHPKNNESGMSWECTPALRLSDGATMFLFGLSWMHYLEVAGLGWPTGNHHLHITALGSLHWARYPELIALRQLSSDQCMEVTILR